VAKQRNMRDGKERMPVTHRRFGIVTTFGEVNTNAIAAAMTGLGLWECREKDTMATRGLLSKFSKTVSYEKPLRSYREPKVTHEEFDPADYRYRGL
jgi:hypothetical protein